jgi:hypothetical protein
MGLIWIKQRPDAALEILPRDRESIAAGGRRCPKDGIAVGRARPYEDENDVSRIRRQVYITQDSGIGPVQDCDVCSYLTRDGFQV